MALSVNMKSFVAPSFCVTIALVIIVITGCAISPLYMQHALAQPAPQNNTITCPPGKVPSQLIKGPPCVPKSIVFPSTRGLILFCTPPLPRFGKPPPPPEREIGLRYYGLPPDRAILVELDRDSVLSSTTYGSTSAIGDGELRHLDFESGQVLLTAILISGTTPGGYTIKVYVYDIGIHYDPLRVDNPDLRSLTPTLIMTVPMTVTDSTYESVCNGGNTVTLPSK
jgi:hypothetical protein